MRPCCNLRPSLVGNHASVTVVPHLLHVWLEWPSSTMWHNVGWVDEQFVPFSLNFRIENDIFSPNASWFEEVDLTKVFHSVSAVDTRVVRDWNQFTTRLCTVASSCRHEFGTEGNIGTLRSKWVFVRGKIWSTNGSNFRILEPSNELLSPVERRNGIIIGKENKIMVHLFQCEIACISAVCGWVFNPRRSIFFTDIFGMVSRF